MNKIFILFLFYNFISTSFIFSIYNDRKINNKAYRLKSHRLAFSSESIDSDYFSTDSTISFSSIDSTSSNTLSQDIMTKVNNNCPDKFCFHLDAAPRLYLIESYFDSIVSYNYLLSEGYNIKVKSKKILTASSFYIVHALEFKIEGLTMELNIIFPGNFPDKPFVVQILTPRFDMPDPYFKVKDNVIFSNGLIILGEIIPQQWDIKIDYMSFVLKLKNLLKEFLIEFINNKVKIMPSSRNSFVDLDKINIENYYDLYSKLIRK